MEEPSVLLLLLLWLLMLWQLLLMLLFQIATAAAADTGVVDVVNDMQLLYFCSVDELLSPLSILLLLLLLLLSLFRQLLMCLVIHVLTFHKAHPTLSIQCLHSYLPAL